MTHSEASDLIAKLAPVCKAHGIRRVRVGDIELEFGGGEPDPESVKRFSGLIEQGMPTPDEVLNWSAPGYVPPPPPEPEAPKTVRGRKS